MAVMAIVNQKGGVGKTTTTQNLGHALVEQGQHVLLVDLDPQASLTLCCSLKPDELGRSVYDPITAAIRLDAHPTLTEVIVRTTFGADLAPANDDLSGAEPDLYSAAGGELIIKQVIEPLRHSYDYILIDCPPNLGLLTVNALTAADTTLIPIQADYLPMKGVGQLLKTVTVIQRRLNPSLSIAGLLLTMADRTLISREVIDTTRHTFEGRLPVFQTVIRRRVELRESPRSGKTVLTYASASDAATDYRELAKEVMHA
jgi:chromosome partitioning protein